MLYRSLIRPLLFQQDPEQAHEGIIRLLETLTATQSELLRLVPVQTHPALQTTVAGITFPNPVGLAAGFDKNGKAIPFWHTCGCGFVEVGTITAQPQGGNPKPRVFRYPEQAAVVNRLGFNSEGSEVVAERIKRLRQSGIPLPLPLAINIGKTKIVEEEAAVLEDYRAGFRRLAPLADLVVINVSSPNTPGLRQWQEKAKLSALLTLLSEEAKGLSEAVRGTSVPLFLKISPDMSEADRDDVVEVALENGLAGLIATNTTIAREGATEEMELPGGLSGKPLCEKSLEVLRYLYRQLQGRLPIIGVGGISSAEEAYARIKAGASLVQVYTGMIYEGPFLPRKINQGLLRLMERDGIKSIADAVGVESR
ncbi:MAG: quinone-dependent dihydroorotate dehydrogenase [Armatimonadetes bacterium]|nr:quinone-dependent dihydroorotate dehydrogenase [Armatimonadota bacterium]